MRLSLPNLVKRRGLGGGGGGDGDTISHLCQIFFSCYAFKRMNSSKMTQIERTKKKKVVVFVLFLYLDVKIVLMEHLWCDFKKNL